MKKIDFIDFGKGYSIITIVIFHYLVGASTNKWFAYGVNFGGAGVHLFFFMSGLGLYLSKPISYFAFLKRRLTKVLIPYYVAVTIIFLINMITGIYPVGIAAYLSHIFLYKMFVPAFDESFGSHFWFISTIVQFYLVFPALRYFINKYSETWVLFSAFLISVIYWIGVSKTAYVDERVVKSFFLQYLWEFVLGMWIGKLNLIERIISAKYHVIIATAIFGISLTALLAIKGGDIGKLFNDIPSLLGYSSIAILVYRSMPILKKAFLNLGNFSYYIYLYHIIILVLCRLIFRDRVPNIIVVTIAFLVSLFVSKLMYLLNLRVKEARLPVKY